jgi:phosphotransferase system HPr (HPr) family protein
VGTARRTLRVENQAGLHARSCTNIVAVARKFRSEIRFRRGAVDADAKSIFDLMLLNAAKGVDLEATATGEDAEAALAALDALFRAKFGED